MIDNIEGPRVGRVDPRAAWAALESGADVCLVDVRCRAEWSFVGVPDLSGAPGDVHFIEWRMFPSMEVNQNFEKELTAKFSGGAPREVYFICRSGGRSFDAAQFIAASGDGDWGKVSLFNVEEGFEGDVDADGHRGSVNGWKVHGLPWRQS